LSSNNYSIRPATEAEERHHRTTNMKISFGPLRLAYLAIVAVVTIGSAAVVSSSTPPSPTPVSHLHVTLKGKKYTLDAPLTTVADLQAQLEAHSGIVPAKQGKILHEGKKLSSSAGGPSLSEAGVSDGDQLNCIPSKKKSSSSSSSSKKSSTSTVAATTTDAATPAAASEGGGLDEMLKKLMAGGLPGGMGGSGGAQPDMKEQMTMLKELISSPIFSEYMSSPEKLEEARQMILTNPMLKGMLAGMPGMGQLLDSPDSWAQAMMAAGSMMQSMDVDEMLQMAEQTQAAMGGMGGMMGGGAGAAETAGLFGDGNIPKASTTTALDELSEDDE